ncbi:polysulfide reductase, partial [Kibdelosporangium lantanae]
AAGGMGMIAGDRGPSRRFAVLGAGLEQVMVRRMRRRMGMVAEPYRTSRYMKAAEVLTIAGAAAAVLGGRSGVLTRLSGAALVAGSALLRWGVFHAGKESAADPKYTVVPQRERLNTAR